MADFECFIIDNGSTDGSIAALPKLDKRFEIIELGENTGFARANNIGAKRARTPWIACLNPDAFARTDWLEKLLAETERGPAVTMVGSTQIMALEGDVYDGAGDCYHVSGLAWRSKFGHKISESATLETCEIFAPCAAASLYHRETFLRLGGFDERFFCYHEDVDIGFRMRLDGGICVQSAAAIVDHVSSGISGRASDFSVYHGTRNRMWTFMKCMPALGLWLFFPAHIVLNLALLCWAMFRPGRFRPTARGVVDGIKGIGPIWKSRKDIHGARRIGLLGLMKFITINPVTVLKRRQHGRPLD